VGIAGGVSGGCVGQGKRWCGSLSSSSISGAEEKLRGGGVPPSEDALIYQRSIPRYLQHKSDEGDVRGKSIQQRSTQRRGSPRGGGGLGPSVDGGTPVGRLRHTAREVVERGRVSLRAGVICRWGNFPAQWRPFV
jgi:hypothetical protein